MAGSESIIDPSRFEMLVQLSENNSGFFDELLRTFYNDATANIDEMRNSLYVTRVRSSTTFPHAPSLTHHGRFWSPVPHPPSTRPPIALCPHMIFVRRENRRHDLHQRAHKMKGASSQIGATRLQHLSKRVMDASEGAPGADLAQLLDAVSDCFEETMAALHKRTEDLVIGGGGGAAESKSHK